MPGMLKTFYFSQLFYFQVVEMFRFLAISDRLGFPFPSMGKRLSKTGCCSIWNSLA
jgi:hypothetical protein